MKKIFLFALLFSTVSSLSLADYAKGLDAFQHGDYMTTEAELRGCLAEKDPRCQYLTAFMYYHGLTGIQSYDKAFALFSEATEQGNTDSRTFLGYMYDEGKGVKKDKKKAFELYQISAGLPRIPISRRDLSAAGLSGLSLPDAPCEHTTIRATAANLTKN